jgi:hypothetical protein
MQRHKDPAKTQRTTFYPLRNLGAFAENRFSLIDFCSQADHVAFLLDEETKATTVWLRKPVNRWSNSMACRFLVRQWAQKFNSLEEKS